MIKVSARDMNQLGSLLLDGRDNFRMAVAGRNHGNARGKVEKLVAVHVFHANAAATRATSGYERV
jgi:hypothetical protein